MNHTYRLVFNRSQNAWVAVAETAKSHSKSGRAKAIAAAVASVLAFNALAMPTGGQVSAGSGGIAQSGNTMTVTQASPNLAINWNAFGIAANETVNFAQPSVSAIALNRVLGSDPSAIYGKLNANGQVFLLNPNGVLFGKSAQVNVGGLVASTLNLSDADFMARNFRFTGTAGSVKNEGSITAAENGYVALLGGQVSNQGSIVAKLGNVSLAAGSDITLDFAGDKLIRVKVDRGTLNALAENKQLIVADGGTVLLTAQAANALIQAVVNNEGVIEARTVDNKSGTIRLMGDMQNGIVKVSGTLDASAPLPPLQGEGRGGDGAANGGFVETSAAKVKVADGAKITTKAAHGLNGSWLIDPVDFTIAATGGDITGAALGTLLASNNVTLQTTTGTNDATNVYGTSGTNGDIFVNAPVSWSANKLTLNAQRNININAVMGATATASLALEYGQGAAAAGNTSSIVTGAAGKVNLPAGTTNFTTKRGSDGAVKNYTVITTLGTTATSSNDGTLQGMQGALAGNYALGADIDAGATSTWPSFTPIGNGATPFTGIFDGLGHTITGLTINFPISSVGLFGAAVASEIRNVGLVNVSVVGGNRSVGGLVGYNRGSVMNSYVTGSVSGSGSNVGGLVGTNYGTISNSYATASVSGSSYVGGLVGFNSGTIKDSYTTGSVSGSSYVGGLVGGNAGTISNSYHTTGGVTCAVPCSAVGGLVGVDFGTVSNSYYDVDSVAVNGANAVTPYGLYQSQFNTWKNAGMVMNPVTYFGAATAPNTYTVTGVQGLKDLLGFTGSTDTFVLAGNVDMASAPAGFYLPLWAGTFDGANHTIANFTLSRNTNDVGFFGVLLTGSTVKNLGLTNANVSGGAGSEIGALVGYNSGGTVSNSYAGGSVSSTSGDDVGGLVGWNRGTISNSDFTSGSVGSTSGRNVGGLVGYNGGTVSNSYYDLESVAVNGANVPGPYALYASQFNSWKNAGKVMDPVTYFGAATAPNTYTVTGVQGLKDLLGFLDSTSTFVLAGNVDMASAPAGFYLPNWAGTFDGANHILTNFTLNRDAADTGLFGRMLTGSTVKNVGLDNARVNGGTGNRVVGGLVGYNAGGTISNSHVTGRVSGGGYVGGLVGDNDGGTISNSYATGSVSGGNYVGGLVGYNDGGTISNSYATASVSGVSKVGGLAGYGRRDTISNSYATGNVSGSDYVGGLVSVSIWSTISNSYATGSVSGSSYVGGLVGLTTNGTTLTANFWNTETSGMADGLGVGNLGGTAGVAGTPQTGVTGLTTAQMHSQASFVPAGTGAGNWDFTPGTGTWMIYEGETNPLLASFIKPLTITANDATKTYDGLAYNGSAGVSYSITPDMANLLGTLTYTSGVNVGSHAISVSGLTSAHVQQGYTITYVDGTLTINPATVVVVPQPVITPVSGSLTGSVSKVYDGTDAATLSPANYVLSGFIGGDGASVTKTQGTYASVNAGSGIPVTVSLGSGDYSAVGSTNLSNYVLPTSITGNVGVIVPKALTVSGSSAAGKTYDGTTAATLTAGTLSGLVGNETLNFSVSGAFDSKNAGNRTVAAHYTLADGTGLASNYSIADESLAATITPKAMAVSGIVASNKTYDGTTAATVNAANAKLDGLVAGDAVSINASGVFADKNAGRGKTVTLTSSYGGADAGNYTIADQASTTADIAPKALSIAGSVAQNKQYDGTTKATVTPGTLTGFVGNETVTVGETVGTFESATVGERKNVTAHYVLANGANGGMAGNYSVADEALLANITPAESYQSAVSSVQQPQTGAPTPGTQPGQSGTPGTGDTPQGGTQGNGGQAGGQAGGDTQAGGTQSAAGEKEQSEKGMDGGNLGIPAFLAPKPVFKIVNNGMNLPDGLNDD